MGSINGDTETQTIRPFQTTQWGVVMAASHGLSASGQEALEKLCSIYWYPLYAYVRRQGYSVENAQDLTQGFLIQLLENDSLKLADPERGRFRSFLLTALKHFLVNEWQKSRTIKRGGTYALVSWDAARAEGRYLAEPVDGLTPERMYEKRWAVTLLEQTLDHLRAEHLPGPKQRMFELLKPHLLGDSAPTAYAELASALGMSEGASRVAMHRLRERYRALLRAEVARTVSTPAEIEEELRHLVEVLRG